MALKPARLQWSEDGTLSSPEYGDIYFQPGRGLEESRHVFLSGNNLEARFQKAAGEFRVAELGFGSGLNFLLTAELFASRAPESARLFYASVEKHPVTRADLEKIYAHFDGFGEMTGQVLAQYPPLVEGFHTLRFLNGRITLMLLFGDVMDVLPQLQGGFDAWFLDGFSPAKNPAMWEGGIFPLMAARTVKGGTAATFSAAGHVRRGLEAAGFTVRKEKGFGEKRDMTVAAFEKGAAHDDVRKSVIVLGAGIAGCAAAHALSRRGHDVTVIDRRGDCALETSGNPAGIVYPKLTVDPSPLGDFHAHAFSYTRALLKSLGLPSWKECGVLHLDLDDEGRARRQELLSRNAFPEDYALEKDGGLFQPMAGYLSPPEFCRALLGQPNVKTVFGRAVSGVVRDGGIWRVTGESGAPLAEADIVVIALGGGSKAFSQTEWLPLQFLRGQVTMLKPTQASKSLAHIICHEGYITPAAGGLHCIGATFQKEEPDGFSPRDEDDAENLEKLNARLPHFGFTQDNIAGSRAGYRATTPDKLPVIGAAPDYEAFRDVFAEMRTGKTVTTGAPPAIEGLYVSTGFGAHGMTGAPLAGEIVAAQVSQASLPVPSSLMEYLVPERFIFRGLKRREI